MRVPTLPPPLVKPMGMAVLHSEKPDILETQFQPVNDSLKLAVIEKVKEALQAYFFTPAS
jgi:hypothetical protein